MSPELCHLWATSFIRQRNSFDWSYSYRRPYYAVTFHRIWFLSRPPTLYFRGQRWLKAAAPYTTKSFSFCASASCLRCYSALGWRSQIHKPLASFGSVCRRILSRSNHQESIVSLEQTWIMTISDVFDGERQEYWCLNNAIALFLPREHSAISEMEHILSCIEAHKENKVVPV